MVPALFKPPPQEDAPSFPQSTARRKKPSTPSHRPFGPLPPPARGEPHSRGCRWRPSPWIRGGHGSPPRTLSLLPHTQSQTHLFSQPLAPTWPGPPGPTWAAFHLLPSAPHPTAEGRRASSSGLKSCTNQSQRNLFLPRYPSTLRRTYQRHGVEGAGPEPGMRILMKRRQR